MTKFTHFSSSKEFKLNTDCEHRWIPEKGNSNQPCHICFNYPAPKLRTQCTKRFWEGCIKCIENKYQCIIPNKPNVSCYGIPNA